jgi:hypothetical protein
VIGLLWFVLAILVSPFRSKARLEAEIADAPTTADRAAAKEAGQGLADPRRSIAFRPALSLVSFDPAGPSNR